jgi:hypothetical protein
MCTERIKSSTTVEAIGSSPAVGSSYRTSCKQTQYLNGIPTHMDLYLCDSLPPSLSSSTNQKKQYKQNGGLQTLSSLTSSAASQNYSPNLTQNDWNPIMGTSCSVCPGLSSDMMARASATLFFMPPDSSEGNRSSTPCLRFQWTQISCSAPMNLVQETTYTKGSSWFWMQLFRIPISQITNCRPWQMLLVM